MILNDRAIRELIRQGNIEHGIDHKIRMMDLGGRLVTVPSFGLEPAGYTFRLGMDILIPANDCHFMSNLNIPIEGETRLDRPPFGTVYHRPNEFERLHPHQILDAQRSIAAYLIPPGQFFLGSSIEYFRVPDDMVARFVPKSTNERIGLKMNTMTGEPGWHGTVTVEMQNITNRTLVLYTGFGCMQVHFEQLTEAAGIPYKGQYNGQVGITLAAL